MIRRATRADLPRIIAIRDDAGEEALCDPRQLTEAEAARLVDTGALLVWQDEHGGIAGFAAGDAGDGSVWALLVAPGQQGRGVGRALLAAVCDALRAAGQQTATVQIAPGSRAEQHYRAAGWVVAANARDALILRKPL